MQKTSAKYIIETMLKLINFGSGSKGNASYITDGKTGIVLDAGVSYRRLRDMPRPDALLITHEHNDHIKFIGSYYGIKTYVHEAIEADIRAVFDGEIKCITDSGFYVGDIYVTPFRLPHDAKYTLGYTFETEDCKLLAATDLGHVNSVLKQMLAGSDMVMLEANHDVQMLMGGSYPQFLKKRIAGLNGHISNDVCGETVREFLPRLKSLMLAHLSEQNNAPELAYSVVRNALADSECRIVVASQNEVTVLSAE